MRSGVGILLGALLVLVPGLPPGPAPAFESRSIASQETESYASVKRKLYGQVFNEHRKTLYCGCPFDSARRPDLEACDYVSARDGKRSKRVEIDHVVPASWIGLGRPCWSQKICRDRQGRPFKGRKCCLAVDPAFKAAYQDMHNLRPTVGEINELRSNFRFGLIEGEAREFGRCDFEIDIRTRRAEPRPGIRGDLARISLYMAETHGVRLSEPQRRLFEVWHRNDPPDADERRLHDRILMLQQKANPLVRYGGL